MSSVLRTLIGVTVSVSLAAISVQAFRIRSNGIRRESSTESPIFNDAGFPKVTTHMTWHPADFLNPHYFIQHGRNCNDYSDTKDKLLGCGLADYRSRGSLVGQGREVHWNLKPWTEGLDYGTRSARNDSNVSLLLGQQYKIPDFCSRAIVSELSTVYSRGRRKNGLGAAVTNTTTISADCSWFTAATNPTTETTVFNPEVQYKACWNLCADYRTVYCLGYSHCARCSDSTDDNCHTNQDLVDCCRRAYDTRIAKLVGDNLPERLVPAPDQGAPAGGSSGIRSDVRNSFTGA